MKNRLVLVGFLMIFTLVFGGGAQAGWLSKSNPDLVKEGSMDVLPSVTIAKVLNARFDNGNWEEFETELGEVVVEFTGRVSQNLQNRAIETVVSDFKKLDYFTLLMQTTGYVSQLTEDDQRALKLKYKPAEGVKSMEKGYYLEAIQIVLGRKFFTVRTPAIIEWAVDPKNENIEISYMASDVWQHIKDESFLIDLIFGR